METKDGIALVLESKDDEIDFMSASFALADGGFTLTEPEAVLPLSSLPSLFKSIYGDQTLAFAGAGAGEVHIHIHNPVVREEQDIDKIAKKVENVLTNKVLSQKRYRRG